MNFEILGISRYQRRYFNGTAPQCTMDIEIGLSVTEDFNIIFAQSIGPFNLNRCWADVALERKAAYYAAPPACFTAQMYVTSTDRPDIEAINILRSIVIAYDSQFTLYRLQRLSSCVRPGWRSESPIACTKRQQKPKPDDHPKHSRYKIFIHVISNCSLRANSPLSS